MFPEMTRDDVFRLETRRLWLRWPKAADATALVALAADPAVASWAARMPLPKARDEAEAYILAARAANAEGAALTLAVTPRARPTETIGALTLQAGPAAVASLGFWIGRPHQGQGFGAEAVEALISMAFGLTHLTGVETAVAPENASSRKVLERLGFVAARADRAYAPALGREVELEWLAVDRAHFLAGVGARAGARPLPSMGHQTVSAGDTRAARALAFAAGQ